MPTTGPTIEVEKLIATQEIPALERQANELYAGVSRDLIMARMTERMRGLMVGLSVIQMLVDQQANGEAAKHGAVLDPKTLELTETAMHACIAQESQIIAKAMAKLMQRPDPTAST